jgi:hypothetical protein
MKWIYVDGEMSCVQLSEDKIPVFPRLIYIQCNFKQLFVDFLVEIDMLILEHI